jgi:hypothetical protein
MVTYRASLKIKVSEKEFITVFGSHIRHQHLTSVFAIGLSFSVGMLSFNQQSPFTVVWPHNKPCFKG